MNFSVNSGLGSRLHSCKQRSIANGGNVIHRAPQAPSRALVTRSYDPSFGGPLSFPPYDPSVPVPPAPHSGYHFDGSDRRFFEGWYFKVTITDLPEQPSFAFIYSVENPKGSGPRPGVGVQVMGPGDGYICQHTPSVGAFWADRSELALGHTFRRKGQSWVPPPLGRMIPAREFDKQVESGFQTSRTFNQGSIVDQPGGATASSELKASVPSCRWEYTVKPVYSYGNRGGEQKATAGWLAALPVFEPHWQVLMSHGLASGWIEWGDQRYEFKDMPAYAEKNWGGGFPKRWMWVQCNTFDGMPDLALTAGGGRRTLPLLGTDEDVALISVHHDGRFVELVPWMGSVSWEVTPWGSWVIRASNERYRAEVEATCDPQAGTPLRAPTADQGLAPFCRDTFAGRVRLRVWDRNRISTDPWIDATSTSGALEVGGGPWWSTWAAQSRMAEPFKSLVTLPVEQVARPIVDSLPQGFRPPGL